MNRQKTGIGWTRVHGRPGYTWNISPGCFHGCEWNLNGQRVECYAKTLAERLKSATFYPEGFQHGYWYEDRLEEPLKLVEPAGIFVNSMGDVLGPWITDEAVEQILNVCREAEQHIFFFLTKNIGRLLRHVYPPNVWIGFSSPADHMHGHPLSRTLKSIFLAKGLKALDILRHRGLTTFVSFEPLSWDVSSLVAQEAHPSWAIIGAGSIGHQKVQPPAPYVEHLLNALGTTPVFMKENLIWDPIRREFPT